MTHFISWISKMTVDWDQVFEELRRAKAVIRKDGPASKPYCVYSEDGTRKFGCFSTREGAEKRLQEIHFFKRQDK